ncbi:MAG: type II secretion system protein GspC [Nannocystaceae bacterium]
MEALFKKHFWIVKALGVIAVVGLAGSALATRLGTSYVFIEEDEGSAETEGGTEGADTEGDDDDDEPKATKSASSGSRSGGKDKRRERSASESSKMLAQLLGNNLFCPSCAPVAPEASEPGAEVGAPVLAADGSQISGIQPGEGRTSLPIKLVVTMESSDPRFSQATILDTENGGVRPFWPGDQIKPGAYLVSVERGLIHIQSGGALEYLELGAEIPKPKAKPKAKKKEEEEEPKKEEGVPGAEDAIKCESENTCTIDRAFVESVLSNPAALAKQARVVPSVVDGEPRGFKFYGIRSGSLPKLLGLKNGDMITAVNGNELKSMDDAMALYAKLRRASNVSITIERKGKQINKEITIQ